MKTIIQFVVSMDTSTINKIVDCVLCPRGNNAIVLIHHCNGLVHENHAFVDNRLFIRVLTALTPFKLVIHGKVQPDQVTEDNFFTVWFKFIISPSEVIEHVIHKVRYIRISRRDTSGMLAGEVVDTTHKEYHVKRMGLE